MIYAVTEAGRRICAEPNQHALCPGCRAPVLSKCGAINVWHWAHASGKECDPWYEPETQWHINWKMQFEESCREVVMGEHRADIFALDKYSTFPYVVELQHSPLEFTEIVERERFYGLMVWIVDGLGFKNHFEFGCEIKTNGGATVEAPFRRKWFRKSWAGSSKALYLDLGDCLWLVTGMNADGTGTVRSLTYHEFLAGFAESIGSNMPMH